MAQKSTSNWLEFIFEPYSLENFKCHYRSNFYLRKHGEYEKKYKFIVETEKNPECFSHILQTFCDIQHFVRIEHNFRKDSIGKRHPDQDKDEYSKMNETISKTLWLTNYESSPGSVTLIFELVDWKDEFSDGMFGNLGWKKYNDTWKLNLGDIRDASDIVRIIRDLPRIKTYCYSYSKDLDERTRKQTSFLSVKEYFPTVIIAVNPSMIYDVDFDSDHTD